jgi:predicted nuclease of predicted toxin-antitoxin system
VRFLVDEALSSRVASLLRDAGHDAVHVGDRGLLGQPDEDVMRVAMAEDRVVVSTDTDFGELLALGSHLGPSVVLLRRAPHAAEQQANLVLTALVDTEGALLAGAVVVITPSRIRLRDLPVRPPQG